MRNKPLNLFPPSLPLSERPHQVLDIQWGTNLRGIRFQHLGFCSMQASSIIVQLHVSRLLPAYLLTNNMGNP